MGEESGIGINELLTGVYEKLLEKLEGSERVMDPPARCEIANDSDWHRTRVGYMRYVKVALINKDGAHGLLAVGEPWGSYPKDPYAGDVIYIPAQDLQKEEELTDEAITDNIEGGSYFRYSLLVGYADGRLGFSKRCKIHDKLVTAVKDSFESYVAQDLETNPELFHLDLRPVVSKAMRYKPEIVEFLSSHLAPLLCQNE